LLGELPGLLAGFAADRYGPRTAVRNVEPLVGHSGLSVAFEVTAPGRPVEPLVIRLAPRPAPVRGTHDMVRQALLMRALRRRGLPVPPVRLEGQGPPWFPVPFHITLRVPGRIFQDWDPDPSFPGDRQGVAALYRQAAELLARLHKVPPSALPISGEAARSPAGEVRHWWEVADRAGTGTHGQALAALRDALLGTAPADVAPGLVHGDFRGGNLLFDGGRLTAALDWEAAVIGPRLLDLAWLLLFMDSARWLGGSLPEADRIAAETLARYRERTGDGLEGFGWYCSLARYRWAAIILFNAMLHSRGKRPDPLFERLPAAIPGLLAEAGTTLTDGERGGAWVI
jgi:aminoglycoside phosphotransferase (APT) family kinase protein